MKFEQQQQQQMPNSCRVCEFIMDFALSVLNTVETTNFLLVNVSRSKPSQVFTNLIKVASTVDPRN